LLASLFLFLSLSFSFFLMYSTPITHHSHFNLLSTKKQFFYCSLYIFFFCNKAMDIMLSIASKLFLPAIHMVRGVVVKEVNTKDTATAKGMV
jgi:hypothetical protein